jgi:beta-phosphoglucomutase-like phosphatase (HAD superfamily)
VAAFIFDIDGTIIDSMPFHTRSWEVFLARRGAPGVDEEFFQRTAGRTGIEVMRELFGSLSDADAALFVREKEAIYRDLFAAEFREIAGLRHLRAAKSWACALRARRRAIPTTSLCAGRIDCPSSSTLRSARTTWAASDPDLPITAR